MSISDILYGDLCKNTLYFHISLFFLIFNDEFIRCVDSTRIAASNTASDDLAN